MKDALAPGGEEGRDKLRKAAPRGTYPMKRGYPNGATRRAKSPAFRPQGRKANPGN